MKYMRITIALDNDTAKALKRLKEINDLSYNKLIQKMIKTTTLAMPKTKVDLMKERDIVDLLLNS
jgi:hypothetical protein